MVFNLKLCQVLFYRDLFCVNSCAVLYLSPINLMSWVMFFTHVNFGSSFFQWSLVFLRCYPDRCVFRQLHNVSKQPKSSLSDGITPLFLFRDFVKVLIADLGQPSDSDCVSQKTWMEAVYRVGCVFCQWPCIAVIREYIGYICVECPYFDAIV